MENKKLTKNQQNEVKKEVHKHLKQRTKHIEQELEKKFHEKFLKTTRQTAHFFNSEFKKQTSTALIAAFGFIVALAWRDLITSIINEKIPQTIIQQYPYLNLISSAIIITIIAIIGIALVTNWAKKPEKTNKNISEKTKKQTS